MTYSIASQAGEELLQAALFYRDHASPAVAQAFISEFERVALLVDENPGLGTPTLGGRRLFLMRRFPYSVIYRVTEAGVRIVVVAHQSRRPGYWRGREQSA